MTDLTTYKLSFMGYHTYVAYRNHALFMVQLPEKNDMQISWHPRFLAAIPQLERDVKKLEGFQASVSQFVKITTKCLSEAKTQADKIVAFSMAYKHYRGVAYSARDTEKSNVKNVPVNRKLLATFFETPGLTNFTIDNYVHRINITKDYAVNGFPDDRGPKMPDVWDREYWRQCDDNTRMAYERSLAGKGYKRKITSQGTIFIKED